MRVILRRGAIVVVPEPGSPDAGQVWTWPGHAFRADQRGGGLVLTDLGSADDVLAEPINVTSRHPSPGVRLISNFAETPFDLHGQRYASVEGFWQGLRTTDAGERARVAALSGGRAKTAAQALGTPARVQFAGRDVAWASPEHWDLMREACRAKFVQVEEAREALLGTGTRPLVHRMRNDSRSIPGDVMAGIWMGLRAELRVRRPHRASTA